MKTSATLNGTWLPQPQSRPLRPFAALRLFLAVIFIAGIASAQTFTDVSSKLHPMTNGSEWGTSAADFNNDGLVDMYERGKIYINRGDEGFFDIFSETGITQGSSTFGAVFGDYDNDSYLDILFENFGSSSLLNRNLRMRNFQVVNSQVNLFINILAQSAGWGDFNLDGTLDLFVNDDNGNNKMYLNHGFQTFQDISASSHAPTSGNSYGMAWGDFNNDRYPDVFIGTCPGNFVNHLLRNEQDETFLDIGPSAGISVALATWGVIWLDYNNDGYWDVYISNTGGDQDRLYRNNGNETFTDITTTAGISATGGYGAAAADFDNDGWIDIYSATSSSTHKLFRNNGDGTFFNISTAAGIVENRHNAVAISDYNGDGWQDIFTAGTPANRLMYNNGGNNHWITIELRGTADNYYGVGARLEAYSGTRRQIREIRAGDSFCSQNDLLRAHFGLGSSAVIDSLLVIWPNGTVDRLENLDADQFITVVQGMGLANGPVPYHLTSPADGAVVKTLGSVQLRWEDPTPASGGAGPLRYKLYLSGSGLDTVFTNIPDNSFLVSTQLLNEGTSYKWMVEATDGYSIRASRDIFSFSYSANVFSRLTTGPVVNDGRFSEGSAWGDYDDDGDADLFVANILEQNNLLYQNDGNGVFTAVFGSPVVSDGGFSYGGQFVDYDDDGDLDLFVNNGVPSPFQGQLNFLYENTGAGFVRVTGGVLTTDSDVSWGGAWADYDRDGLLDLFVANFNQNNALYHNLGGGQFERISSGPVVSDQGASLTGVWGDYDNDGNPDLFVANADFAGGQNNFLYHNNGDGTFSKELNSQVVNDGGNSVAGSWADYDDDGDLDLFVTNYFGEDNFLYQNNLSEGLGFTRILVGDLVNDGGLSVGSNWGDLDNDGDLDLAVSDDQNGGFNRLYINEGNGRFTKVSAGQVVTDQARSNSMTWSDIDGDGDLDLFVANGDQPTAQNNFLYVNEMGEGNHWLNIRLAGTISNEFGVGARVRVLSDIGGEPRWQSRELVTATGYNSQNGYLLHFGLAEAAQVDSISVQWPSGARQLLAAVAADQTVIITEDSTLVGIPGDGAEVPEGFALHQNYPNPFNPSTVIEYNLPVAGPVVLRIYSVLGQEVKKLVEARQEAGIQRVNWDGTDAHGRAVGSGIYFYQLHAGSFQATRKMILMR